MLPPQTLMYFIEMLSINAQHTFQKNKNKKPYYKFSIHFTIVH